VAKKRFEYQGLSCPAPLLKLSVALMKHEMAKGDVIEVVADCPFFEDGLKKWCVQTESTLLSLRTQDKTCTATVRVGVA
jgi:tRNA 2-thiouridine synthesizing protein A